MDKIKLLTEIFHDEIYKGEIEEGALIQYLQFVDDALSTLDDRKQEILRRRYGGETLRFVAQEMGGYAERIRQLQHKAIIMLRHPTRKQILMGKRRVGDYQSYSELVKEGVDPKLLTNITELSDYSVDINILNMSTRLRNCFKNANILFIPDLLSKTESELLSIKHFGRKSLNETKQLLVEMGLCLRFEKCEQSSPGSAAA